MSVYEIEAPRNAILDEAHVGDIKGALGTIQKGDIGPRKGWRARLMILLAIFGPGPIVMVGDNDAGAFGTYTQAGQDYGTVLLRTLLFFVPVLYVNQEMALRFSLVLVAGSLLLVPVFLMIYPPFDQIAHDFVVPQMPKGAPVTDVLLIIIPIIGTTVAPWQLFFQQSYVIDKRITPRFIRYERIDLWIGIGFVIVGVVAMMAFAAAAFAGHPEFGHFADAGTVAAELGKYASGSAGVMFAVALIDACIIGASAVSFATAYAIGDVLSPRHSLHRKPAEAKGFYAVFFGLIALSAALVLAPGTPLGFLTNAVQTLASILLPSATVFLLLLCNDRAVLGPWTNSLKLNMFTGAVIAVLVMLSITLTASVLFPNITSVEIVAILAGGSAVAAATAIGVFAFGRSATPAAAPMSCRERDNWRMPPLDELSPNHLTLLNRIWMIVLRAYLVVAGGLVLLRIVQLATAHN